MSIILMSLSIILTYCSEVKLQHTDNPEIFFRFQEKYGTDFIVEKYQPLDIVLDNFFAKYAWCLNFYYNGPDDIFIKHISFDGSSDAVMGVPKVQDNMITKWWCVVLKQYKVGKPYNYFGRNYTAYNIVFNLHIKGSSIHSVFDYKLIYITSAIALATILIVVVIIVIKKCCCKQSSKQLQLTINPDSVFYLNLEIFRRQYERELQAQEPEYEEID